MISIETIQNKIEVILFKFENKIRQLFNLSCIPCGHHSRYNEECWSEYFCDKGYCSDGISRLKRPPLTYLYHIITHLYNWIISYFYCKIKGYTPSKFKIK
jgi:hypothetical protein